MQQHEYQAMYELEDSHWWFVGKRMVVQHIVDTLHLRSNARIADIGCGTGGMYGLLRRYGSVIGIEPTVWGRVYAKKRGMKVIAATAQHTRQPKASLDLVCFFDVLYHRGIPDDTIALAEAYRILKPKGWIVITDCAFPFLHSLHDVAVYGARRYTAQALQQKLEACGFTVTRTTYMYFFLFPLFVVRRMGMKLWSYMFPSLPNRSDVGSVMPWVNHIGIAICSAEAMLLQWMSFPWGSSVLVVARKPMNNG